jgi:predicted NBD/HSP70 family sugar kinase
LSGASFTQVTDLLEHGHAQGLELMEQVGRQLGLILGNTLNLLNPMSVILGGELVIASQWLREPLLRAIEETSLPLVRDTPILFSNYIRNNCSLGAAALVFHEWLLQPAGSRA